MEIIHQIQRALVVDEERSWHETLQDKLTSEGFSVDFSDRLDQGLIEAGRKNYAKIFVNDRVLDTSDCKVRLQHLLKSQRPGQEVILVSDVPHWQRAREAFLLGADNHLVKPIKPIGSL